MRTLVLMLVVLVGCAVDAPSEDPVITLEESERELEMDGGKEDSATPSTDICELAAALPADDICRHVCDPVALGEQLVADGAEPGACYQLYCELSQTQHVLVGVCILP